VRALREERGNWKRENRNWPDCGASSLLLSGESRDAT
jgi:hypothetical protein